MTSYDRDWKEVNAQPNPMNKSTCCSVCLEKCGAASILEGKEVYNKNCPCHVKATHEIEGWEEEYDKLGNRKEVKDFIHRLLTHQQESIIAALEIKREKVGELEQRFPGGFGCCGEETKGYDMAITDAIEVVKGDSWK